MQDKQMEINLARPTPSEIIQLWNTIQIQRLDNWTSAANALKEKISEVYCYGGIQLHKFKIIADKNLDWFTEIMEQGGAYQKTNYETARRLALNFVKLELEMRITEFNCFFYNIASAHWFHHIAWDYSFLIFDKRKYEIIFIDMTDTD